MNLQNDIAKYIGALLYEYSTIIIPDLGMFSTHWKSATVDSVKGVITPPAKIVSFNERIKVNDGLMAGHISRVEKIPLQVAEESLKDWVAAANARLAAGDAIQLEGIGYLKRQDGVTQFTLAENANFAVDTFGLTAVKIPSGDSIVPTPATTTGPRKLVADEVAEETVVGVAANTLNTPPPVVTTETSNTTKSISEVLSGNSGAASAGGTVYSSSATQRKEGGLWVKWLIPLLLLFLVFWGISQMGGETDRPWYNRKPFSFIFGTGTEQVAEQQPETYNTPEPVLVDSTIQQTTTTDTAVAVPTETVNTDTVSPRTSAPTPAKETPTPTTNTTTADRNSGGGVEVIEGLRVMKSKTNEYVSSTDPKGFYVITGAFKSKANAQKLIGTLRKDGQDVHLLETTSGYFRAGIYVKSGKISDVKTTFNKAQKQYNPDSWVLKYN